MAAAMLLIGAAWLAGSSEAATLPAGLASPDHGVVCDRERAICHDRYGPSIGLTEAFLGGAAAERLTAVLREHPPDYRPGAVFSPAEGVECVRETGPCRINGNPDAALTAVAPAGKEGNWIQTMPGKSFNTLIRLYGPLQPWFDKTWKPGDLELVK